MHMYALAFTQGNCRASVAKLSRFLGWKTGSQPALVGTHVYSGNTVAAYSFAWLPVHAAHLFGQCASQANVSLLKRRT